jgi:hypothetical protein
MTHESPHCELTYNLFRRKGRSRLHCAVPQDWHVPAFINDKAWDFVGCLERARPPRRTRRSFRVARGSPTFVSVSTSPDVSKRVHAPT